MKSRILLGAAIAAMTAAGAVAAENPSPEVKVAAQGLRVVRPAPFGNDDLRAFNWSPGTTVALIIGAPAGGLVAFDDDGSVVTSFVDDQGKDLTKSEGKGGFGRDKAGFEMMHNISKDAKLCSAEVTAPGVPTRGAQTVTVAGNIALRLATRQKDFSTDGVALKVGTKIAAGAVPLSITEAGKERGGPMIGPLSLGGGGDGVFAVTFQATKGADSVARIEFFDASGKAIKAELNSRGFSSFGSDTTVTWTYHLKQRVDTAKIVVWCWTDMKKVTVPFKLTVGVGL